MNQFSNKSLGELCSNNSQLNKLLAKANRIARLQDIVSTYLDQHLVKHCCVTSYEDGHIILSTTSPEWKHNLRFYMQDLLENLKMIRGLERLQGIRIRVDPNFGKNPDLEINNNKYELKVERTISKESANTIEIIADSISNEKLSASLKRLSQLGSFSIDGLK